MISTLETALRKQFDLEQLAVYADALLSKGDMRGELCSIDLATRSDQTTPAMQTRRAYIVDQLGNGHARHAAIDTTFGFVKIAANAPLATIDGILCSALGPFVREIAIEGNGQTIAAALTTLGIAQRPWLARLVVRQPYYSGDGNVAQSIVDTAITASPNLEELVVVGKRLFAAFPHPRVSRLEITGVDAIIALASTGQGGMPGVVALDYCFQLGNAPPSWDRRRVLLPSHFPCVTSLDLTRNTFSVAPDTDYELFRFLRMLPIAPQLQRLCLPMMTRDEDVANAQTLLDRIPDLRELVILDSERAKLLEHRKATIEIR